MTAAWTCRWRIETPSPRSLSPPSFLPRRLGADPRLGLLAYAREGPVADRAYSESRSPCLPPRQPVGRREQRERRLGARRAEALPDRPLAIVASRASDDTCLALATTSIAGGPAHLFNVYVHLRWYGVDYVLLQGWRRMARTSSARSSRRNSAYASAQESRYQSKRSARRSVPGWRGRGLRRRGFALRVACP